MEIDNFDDYCMLLAFQHISIWGNFDLFYGGIWQFLWGEGVIRTANHHSALNIYKYAWAPHLAIFMK